MALKKTALKTLSGIAAIGLTLGIAAPASADEGGGGSEGPVLGQHT